MSGRTLIAELADGGALARFVRAALRHEVALVPVASPPQRDEAFTLQLRVPGTPAVSLAAETAGPPEADGVPLRLRPLDPSHVAELTALVEELPPSLAPVSKSASAIFDSKPPLPSGPRTEVEPPAVPTERGMGDWKKTDPSATHLLAAEIHPADEEARTLDSARGLSVTGPLTPTTPFEPAGARWRDLARDAPVTEDSGTFPSSQDAARSLAASSSSRGPRTLRRQHAIIGAGRVVGGKYRIEAHVGSGAVGAVYRASHGDLGRDVAIKVLHPHCRADPHLLESFHAEARAASLLHHPNVTVVHDFGEDPDGTVYIVMEYLAGRTLHAVLADEGRLAQKRALMIMLQVCAALAAAHERGIVHRDVKPDNVLLVPSRDDEGLPYELAKVCDFGIAALAGPSLTVQGDGELTAGTPEYMAPEQARGDADARTDVYACGVVLYESLCGTPPFVADTPKEILRKHATETARRLIELVPVDARVDEIVMRALDKSPDRRFGSMRDLRAALRRVLELA